jgi:hypothetical protein
MLIFIVINIRMKTVIETSFGKQENREIILNDISLEGVGHHTEHEALKKGFLIDNNYWYMSRSTRVCTAETNYEEYNEQWEIVDTLTPVYKKRLEKILDIYIKKHSFTDFGRTLSPSDRCKFFIYYQNNEIVAFTKMQFYPIPMQIGYQIWPYKGIETYMFAWDYANPELRLGEVTLQHEIAWAKKYKNPNGGGDQGYEYLYTGPGYERSSIYKADVDGFEWWTGMEWSKDVKKYKQLCRRDSKIRSFKALSTMLD